MAFRMAGGFRCCGGGALSGRECKGELRCSTGGRMVSSEVEVRAVGMESFQLSFVLVP